MRTITKRPAKAPGQTICPRCGAKFKPQKTTLKTIAYTRFCETCCCRNIFDGLGLPTPPELLDKFTKKPTLTDVEFKKKLKEDTDDADEC